MTVLTEMLPPVGSDPMDVIDAFGTWAAGRGRPLYPHQAEAALALAAGDHVVLATPTGSGKSMVAIVGIVLALNAGQRSVWTAPIKALVAEKFFDLVDLLGADAVGLATGDASINPSAPVLVCTAEVLANHALVTGAASEYAFACLDEFHYYADSDRGWAWQVPLLELTRCQMLLASATLGDMTAIATDLFERSGRDVTEVTSVDRPTPLHHQWRMTSVADSVLDAVRGGLTPVYVVHATQAAAIERAQGLVSLNVTTREQREAIKAALAGVRMGRGFGEVLDRLLRNGVGVHHAGMLPRYRRLVERLAGTGLLPVICGTDTLGVGVNIPIRTVLMTALTKFDGNKVRSFTVREFHQLAGRAGRPGFDPDGHVWAQAPDHVIENAKALSRAGDDPKARRKAAKAKMPEGFVHYDEATMNRLVNGRPEPLTSRFKVTPDLVASVLGRPDGADALKHLLRTNHDAPARRRQHRKRALAIYRSLEAAGVARRRRDTDGRCLGVRIGSADEPDGTVALRLSAPLIPFAIELVGTFDRDDPAYLVDVVSVVESVLDDPRQVLFAQQNVARTAELNRLKAEGIEYDERIARLDSVSWPQPLGELLDTTFATYRERHPWVGAGAVGEVDRARDGRGRRHVRLVRAPLPPGAQRGPRVALPHRRVAHARPLTAGDRLHRRARRRDRVARRADPRHRRDAARRVDVARRSTGARPPRPGGADRRGRPAGGVAHRGAHGSVRLGGAVGDASRRRAGRPQRVDAGGDRRGDGTVLVRARVDRHRRGGAGRVPVRPA